MTNINVDEIEKFAQLAQEWWDPLGAMKPLHQMNPLRLQFVLEQTSLAHKKVLDVGCGGGLLSEAMANAGALVTGIDMGESVIAIAKDHASLQNLSIDYQLVSVEDFAQKNPETFDVITCMELLEHVPDPLSVIKACSQLLKKNGCVIFSTINRNLKAYTLAILGAEYLLNLLPKGTHQYAQFIKPSELCEWSERSGLQLKELAGLRYHPLGNYFESCKDVSVNYLACFAK